MPAPRPNWVRTVKVITATQVAILIAFNFVFPFLPLFIQELGVTGRAELALWTGLVIGASGITMAFVAPVWGLVADRFGRKSMFVRAVAAGSILAALQATVNSVWQLAAVRVLQGAFSGTQTAGAMLLAGIVPRERTGFALGMFNTAGQLGNLAGPIAGGIVVASIGLRGSFLVGALLLAICTVITIVWTDDIAVEITPARRGIRGLAREIVTPFRWPALRGVLLIATMVQIVFSGTVALIAIYAQDLTRPSWLSLELTIGLALASTALSAAVAMPILGAWADAHDARILLIASLALVAVSFVPQAIVPDALAFVALRLLLGAGTAGVTSAIAVLTRASAPVGGVGRAFGALSSAQNFGWGIGPIIGSALAAVIGIPGLYVVAAALALLLVPIAFTRSWFPAVDARNEVAVPTTVGAEH